jgi:DNA-3-methyladenine glycosylase
VTRQRRLPRGFYARPTLDVARDLIGKILVHRRGNAVTSGVIVEVEAYIGESDPACHAAPGPTRRNQPLYGPPGHAYVYLNYGIHCLMNVVTESKGSPAAVLIRALEPLEGIACMRRRRSRATKGRLSPAPTALPVHGLCRGPGNVTMAMGITLKENTLDLLGDRLCVEDRGVQTGPIAWGPRIGIRVGVDRPWRACVTGHPAVSAANFTRPDLHLAPATGPAPVSASPAA